MLLSEHCVGGNDRGDVGVAAPQLSVAAFPATTAAGDAASVTQGGTFVVGQLVFGT